MSEARVIGWRSFPPVFWLAAAAALQTISNGRWIVPLAAWLAPICWLTFFRRSRQNRSLVVGLVVFVLVQFVAWWRLIPAPGALYFVIAGAYGIVYFLPYIAHRFIAPRLRGMAATLILPLAWVAIEFVFHRWVTPYGSWFSLAYTQTWSSSLLQLNSVTGTWGVSFLVMWLGSVAAAGIAIGTEATDGSDHRRAEWKGLKRSAALLFLVLLAVWLNGMLRLSGSSPTGNLIRTAGLVPSPTLTRELERALAPIRGGETATDELLDTIRPLAERLNADLFERTKREARAGARLVAWSETAGRILEADEPGFLRRAGELAADEDVLLLLAYGVWKLDSPKPFDNKVVAIDTTGTQVWQYRKANPIVGGESFFTSEGDGVVRYLETDHGRIGAVICHDLDFPPLLRQASRSDIGLIVGPSADWAEITPLHANMAIVRAVESGFSLLRPTSGGRSIAVDPRGRPAAIVDFPDDAMVAYLPTEPMSTVYGELGDSFAWLCLTGFLAALLSASVRPSTVEP